MSTEVTVNLTTTPIELTATITTGGLSRDATDLTTTGMTAGNFLRVAAAGGVEEHTLVSADVSDATDDGNVNKEKLLKTDGDGLLTVTEVKVGAAQFSSGDFLVRLGTDDAATADVSLTLPTVTSGNLALTSQSDGSITSADIADAAADHTDSDNYGKAVLSDANGLIKSQSVWGYDSVKVGSADREATIGAENLTANRALSLPDAAGIVAVVPSYADEAAANTAEAANVVYYNVATGKFQITTA